MTRYRIERTRWGWWIAYDPAEPLGIIDSHTKRRAWTKERLVRKLERRAERLRRRELARQYREIDMEP